MAIEGTPKKMAIEGPSFSLGIESDSEDLLNRIVEDSLEIKDCYVCVEGMVPDALVILKLDVEHIEEAMQNMLICLRDGDQFKRHLVADGDICNMIWSTNSSGSIQEPLAKMLDSGNLVLKDGEINMILLIAHGLKFDHIEFPELVIRQGIWNGVAFNSDDWTSFTGMALRPQLSVTKNEVVNWDEPGDRLSRFMIRDDGLLERYIWDSSIVKWTKMYEARKDLCDNYGACGINGVCNIDDVASWLLDLVGNLVDIRLFISENSLQLDLYVRLAASEIGHRNKNEEQASPLFDIDTILAATDSFSIENKIGQGGFGPVYKGILAQGKEIGVKRLSKTSKQGVTEFMNEVGLVAKLQRRNLVSVLGRCTYGNERMLVYEYMPNGSLNHFIFDPVQGKILQWRKRYDIITGVARGLLYLHQDSKLTIVHRDLKTRDSSAVTTNKIVGTIGYMSPEYAVNGLLSLKSDVFSFGVIVLEILSGIRNNHFKNQDHPHNLLGQGRALEFMDASIPSELLRCLQVGLLCVQKLPEDRPDMSSVVSH
ncbi:tyrosine kinase family protein [Medicago truncatula]|uniref:non-specific serine/threonine protein kinase n=1 Tax=Medicago truncatula TaxID=3880 RepID=G7ILE2_MEDTR|nr:tyrosine kinase family protein [Medicago truncatula]